VTLVAVWFLALGTADVVRWRAEATWRRQAVALAAASLATAVLLGLGDVGLGSLLVHTTGVTVLVAWWLAGSWWAVADRRGQWLGLSAAGGGASLVIAAAPASPELGGPLPSWYAELPYAAVQALPLDRFLVVVSAAVFLTASANVIVRLVLESAGSSVEKGEQRLKGGRLLGPMERVFPFGLGVAGSLTAAAIIVAAKGLLRFPELRQEPESRIDLLTEYFLIGSMASWLLALAPLMLL
jgi:hypothetical protein